MIDITLPGMDNLHTQKFIESLINILDHGYGQVTLVISDGRITTILPAPSIKVGKGEDMTMPAYRLTRKEKRE